MNINPSYKIHQWLRGFLEHYKPFILGLTSTFPTQPDTYNYLGMLLLLHGTHNKAFYIHDFSVWCYCLCKPESTYCPCVLSRYLPYISPILSPTHSLMLCLLIRRQRTKDRTKEASGTTRMWCYTAVTALHSHKPRPMKNIKLTLRDGVFSLIKSETLNLQ